MSRPTRLSARLTDDIASRLHDGQPVRRVMPGWGRLHVDRQLPFLVVYRRPEGQADPGTERLIVGQASYLLASGDVSRREEVRAIVRTVSAVMTEVFGAFLVIEVWAMPDESVGDAAGPRRISFSLRDGTSDELEETISELGEALRSMRVLRTAPVVTTDTTRRTAPPGMRQLFDAREARTLGISLLGVGVTPAYRDEASGVVYPGVLRSAARKLGVALERAAYRFTLSHTTARPRHYHALGRRATVRAVRDVDAALTAIDERFDLLLQATPVNLPESWRAFRRGKMQHNPHFRYRPVPFDPGRIKHDLWSIRTERVEDPTLMYLFREKQLETDRRLTLLGSIGRPEFLLDSLQIHGGVGDGLVAIARDLLDTLPRRTRHRGATVGAREFAQRAAEEIAGYAEIGAFAPKPEVREDIYSGLLVSDGKLLVGAGLKVPAQRVDALIQHEVGTHLVTYYNGAAQPLGMLRTGLPGYDEMQEGLAVLGEYLVGGLDAERLRVLAARVLAAHAVIEGAEFVETYRMLVAHGFTQLGSFTIAARVHRGGGLVKDAMYLRGLLGILDYVAEGGDLDRLFLGKYAASHLQIIDELVLREVLKPMIFAPNHLRRDDAQGRLMRLRSHNATVHDLVKG